MRTLNLVLGLGALTVGAMIGYRIINSPIILTGILVWLGTILTMGVSLLGAAYIVRSARGRQARTENPQIIDGVYSHALPAPAPARLTYDGASQPLSLPAPTYAYEDNR